MREGQENKKKCEDERQKRGYWREEKVKVKEKGLVREKEIHYCSQTTHKRNKNKKKQKRNKTEEIAPPNCFLCLISIRDGKASFGLFLFFIFYFLFFIFYFLFFIFYFLFFIFYFLFFIFYFLFFIFYFLFFIFIFKSRKNKIK